MAEEKIYDAKVKEARTHLHKLEEEINDLKVSYDYTSFKSSPKPYEMKDQIALVDKISYGKNEKNGWVASHIDNYGTFMTMIKAFDLFEKKEAPLKEEACRMLMIERAIRGANDYIKNNRELLPMASLFIEDKEVFGLCQDYLKKVPYFYTFDRQEYRSSIIRQAMCDLKEDDIKKAITNHVIRYKDIERLPDILPFSAPKETIDRYAANIKMAKGAFTSVEKANEVKTEETFSVKAVGVTFDNEDGTSRQSILSQMNEDENRSVTLKRGEYKGKPSVAIIYDKETVGFLSQTTANMLKESYPESPLSASDIEITGGYEKRKANGEVYTAPLGLSLTVHVGLIREDAKEKTAEKEEEKEEDKELS